MTDSLYHAKARPLLQQPVCLCVRSGRSGASETRGSFLKNQLRLRVSDENSIRNAFYVLCLFWEKLRWSLLVPLVVVDLIAYIVGCAV